jgi:hypothetical protein
MAPQHVCWDCGSSLRCRAPRNHQVGADANKQGGEEQQNQLSLHFDPDPDNVARHDYFFGLFEGFFNGGTPLLNPAFVFLIGQFRAKI